jgi:DNA-binding protein HU-beta
VTKSEFVEQLARQGRFATKKEAADALEAVLEGVESALGRGEPVNLTGFGKFSVADRAPREGVNPRTRERITIPGGRVPRFSAGAGLKARVKG